jgi:hypothetical protein
MDKPLEERVNICKQELGVLLKKHNLKIGAAIRFPQYNILPDDVVLAMKVLNNHGVQYHIVMQEADKK